MTNRPDPEKLLQRAQQEAQQEKRGQLKIFLGAAPGVGKTYTMLEDALAKRAEGLDVVVGVVETHGRIKVEALLENMEILPRQPIEYHEHDFLEFDLDAALKRHPGLILIDEMAHTNVRGLRHTKRWQDIKEILDRGIDVYTTLNVQHLESLNDVISQILHIRMKETVPDFMLERATTIELIDLPPEDLLKRLNEGEVYFPQQIEMAKKHFFRKGNLIALRELALRVTAEQVSAQVLLYRKGQGIKYIWPTKEKLLVCISAHPDSAKLIRAARRLATKLQAEWLAIHIETPQQQSSKEQHNRAIQHLRLAEQLGAETHLISGFNIVKEIIAFARDQNVTQIVLRKSSRSRWRDRLLGNLADELVRYSGEIDIYIITGEENAPSLPRASIIKSNIPWSIYGAAFAIVFLATVINFFMQPYLKGSNLIMVYLLAVTFVALFGRAGPATFASILSVLVYDFFFIPPLYSFAVDDAQYFFTLLVMLVVTQTISHLTIFSRREAQAAQFAQQHAIRLHQLSHQLSTVRGIDNLLQVAVNFIGEVFDCEVWALLPEGNQLVTKARYKTQAILPTKELSVAQWVYDLGQHAGLGTDTLPFSDALYLPLLTPQGTIGVFRLHPLQQPERLLTPDQMHLLEACLNQIALALAVEWLQESG